MFKPLLREPLLHFLVVGSFLFIILSNNDNASTKVNPQLVISEGKIQQLSAQFSKTQQREPSPEELEALINFQVREDLAFKQGSQMGLVDNDTIIKRRIQQKLEFMLNDSIASMEPSKEQLQHYLASHKDKFIITPVYSFKHIYINPQAHENSAVFIAQLQTQNLDDIYQKSGDSIMLNSDYYDMSTPQIERLFGQKFTNELDQLGLNQWQAPIKSGYGLHFVKIEKKTPQRIATFDEMEFEIKRDFRIDAQKEAIDTFYKELTTQYDVIIEKDLQ